MVVQSTLTELGDYTLRVTVEYADPATKLSATLAAPSVPGTAAAAAAGPGAATRPYAQRLPSPNMSPPALTHVLVATCNNPPPGQAPTPLPQADANAPPKARALLGAPLATVPGALPGSDPLGASALPGRTPSHPAQPVVQPVAQMQPSQQPQQPPMYNNQQQPRGGASCPLSPPRVMRKYYRFKVRNTEIR